MKPSGPWADLFEPSHACKEGISSSIYHLALKLAAMVPSKSHANGFVEEYNRKTMEMAGKYFPFRFWANFLRKKMFEFLDVFHEIFRFLGVAEW